MKTNYFEELWKYENIFQNTRFMCYYECFMEDFDENVYLPFDDSTINYLFPVVKGTKYSDGNALSLDIAKALGQLSMIPESSENHYEDKINRVLNNCLSKELFTEHSLFLMKEHCRFFSLYSDKAKELIEKLEMLENNK